MTEREAIFSVATEGAGYERTLMDGVGYSTYPLATQRGMRQVKETALDQRLPFSPYGKFVEHCKKGELAYQVCTDDSKAVFFPRIAAPVSGSTNLEWRVSKGLGTVHATTVVHMKDTTPYNVALIDVDEGFRMMSRVEDIDPMQVTIGMRVKVRMHPGDDKQPPYPVFVPAHAVGVAK